MVVIDPPAARPAASRRWRGGRSAGKRKIGRDGGLDDAERRAQVADGMLEVVDRSAAGDREWADDAPRGGGGRRRSGRRGGDRPDRRRDLADPSAALEHDRGRPGPHRPRAAGAKGTDNVVVGLGADDDDPIRAARRDQQARQPDRVKARCRPGTDHQIGASEAEPDGHRAGDDIARRVRRLERAHGAGTFVAHGAGDSGDGAGVAEIRAGDDGGARVRPTLKPWRPRRASQRAVHRAQRQAGGRLLGEQPLAPQQFARTLGGDDLVRLPVRTQRERWAQSRRRDVDRPGGERRHRCGDELARGESPRRTRCAERGHVASTRLTALTPPKPNALT
jgi:hypothetical protein